MKLLKLTVDNFRVFYGKHVLNLDVADGKPAVLIFGMNGAGKTTLLNAFAWALYGSFSNDVERQERVINDHAWAQTPFGTPVSGSVKLEFEHEGSTFVVLREVTVTRSTQDQDLPNPRLLVTETRLGESVRVDNGQDRIEKILPEGLRRFFFFNGERMERMFVGDGSEDVKNAIKTLLGLEAIERAIDVHLPAARRKLMVEAQKLGDGRLQQLAEQQTALDAKKLAVHAKLLKLSDDISSYKRASEDAAKALLDNGMAAPLQKRRVKLNQELNAEKERYQELQERKRKALAERGFISFTAGIDESVMELAEGMRRRQELPAGIQRDYIEGLLEDGTCMCGTPVPEGSAGFLALSERKYNAGLVDVQARWMNLRGNSARLMDARRALLDELRDIARDQTEVESRIHQKDAEQSDIDRQLQGVDVMDVQKLEQRRKEFDEKRFEAESEHRRAQDELEEVEAEIAATRRKLHSAEIQNEEARRVQSQLALIDEVIDAFTRILNLKTEEVRRELDARVKSVFSRIFVKTFVPEVTSSFELELKADSNGMAAIRSTGENQILGLSFVGAVSEMARERDDRKRDSEAGALDEGGVYPVVMDAPFGSLDVEYQDQVAESLPKLTSQIITLLSQSQARGRVMHHLSSAATRMYVLRNVTPKPDAQEQFITINNRAVPYVTRGEFEHSVLEEVTV
ncbi:AAA family ATPase [Streptomyces kaniharaensis]|uniref:Nuclease SbcCD subunit C n=1 Tax=Streptomyces kaniharaensis TaxID=212423 RepID=A0A6N7KVW6_9ACTN|nr:AAA family ATPase [Streptomyces kaniharaensis]MQS14749.1 AAA family ATPase [Streptomyces kaniharaensis]